MDLHPPEPGARTWERRAGVVLTVLAVAGVLATLLTGQWRWAASAAIVDVTSVLGFCAVAFAANVIDFWLLSDETGTRRLPHPLVPLEGLVVVVLLVIVCGLGWLWTGNGTWGATGLAGGAVGLAVVGVLLMTYPMF